MRKRSYSYSIVIAVNPTAGKHYDDPLLQQICQKLLFFPMKKAVKTTIVIGLTLVTSWYVAVWWASTTDRLFYPFFEELCITLYPLLNAVLSSDITEAEDQLWFLSHWLPTFLIFAMIFLLGQKMIIRRRRNDTSNLSLDTDSHTSQSALRSKATK